MNPASGDIEGTPTAAASATTYLVRATNSAGEARADVQITVLDPAEVPGPLSYPTNPAVYTVGVAIAANVAGNQGSTKSVTWSVAPALPAGLQLDTASGTISGTPGVKAAQADYAISATNAHGTARVTFTLTVNDPAPTGLSYPVAPLLKQGVAMAKLVPTVTHPVDSWSVAPPLPPGSCSTPRAPSAARPPRQPPRGSGW